MFVNIHLHASLELPWLNKLQLIIRSGSSQEQPAGARVRRLSIFRREKESWAGSPFTLNFVIIEESAENSAVISTTPEQ